MDNSLHLSRCSIYSFISRFVYPCPSSASKEKKRKEVENRICQPTNFISLNNMIFTEINRDIFIIFKTFQILFIIEINKNDQPKFSNGQNYQEMSKFSIRTSGMATFPFNTNCTCRRIYWLEGSTAAMSLSLLFSLTTFQNFQLKCECTRYLNI